MFCLRVYVIINQDRGWSWLEEVTEGERCRKKREKRDRVVHQKQDILSENPDYLESVTSSVICTVLIITLFRKFR